MRTLRDILSNPLLGGIGIIVTILIGFIGFYYAQRQKVWLIISGLIMTFLIGLFLGAWLFNSGTQEQVYPITVSASDSYPFTRTGIQISVGDDIEIIAQENDPNWSCGLDPVSPYGHINDKRQEEILPSANLCELIGHIGDNSLFRVGAYTHFTSTSQGNLYLGANDAKDCSIAADCYADNIGALSVRVVVRKP